MSMLVDMAGFGIGCAIAMVTVPVGVSGAVFLLPVQLSVLGVPTLVVTPTNLLFNVVSGPGALARYRRGGLLAGSLTRLMIVGTLPGVVCGAIIRVFAVPGPKVFNLLVGLLLLPLGLWLCTRTLRSPRRSGQGEPSRGFITGLALATGVVGGIYGIGGGSILGPILVGRGLPVALVAPAALASTFLTSVVGTTAYVALAFFTTSSDIAPVWGLGLACGAGGLIGGYLGARLQPRLPETILRLTLGALAITLAALYLIPNLD